MNFLNVFRAADLKENLPMDFLYFFKELLWTSASDEAALKIIFDGSKPSAKLTLKTKWYHSSSCCDDSQRTTEEACYR